MFAVRGAGSDSFAQVSLGINPARTAMRVAMAAATAVILMTGLSACGAEKRPDEPIEGTVLEYNGTIAHQVIVLENGKRVDCAVAAANGVSLTCDWAGAH